MSTDATARIHRAEAVSDTITDRPRDLPDFTDPPLIEVVMGVQFPEPHAYSQIYAGEIWNLFRDQFPQVQELPAIMPQFETFGRDKPGTVNFELVDGPGANRFWFITEGGDQLVQFQSDRLLHNWRKREGLGNVYPRYESMVVRFRQELEALNSFFAEHFDTPLAINQAEITYINYIVADETSAGPMRVGDWLNVIGFDHEEPTDFNTGYRREVRNEHGKPIGRLIAEIKSGRRQREKDRLIALNLTVRGAPMGPSIAQSIDFLTLGREMVVKEFAAITTPQAHEIWGRTQ